MTDKLSRAINENETMLIALARVYVTLMATAHIRKLNPCELSLQAIARDAIPERHMNSVNEDLQETLKNASISR